MIVSPHSAGTYTTPLNVMVDKVKDGGRSPPPPHQAGLIFPSSWNVHQKVAIAALCVLCGRNSETSCNNL